MASTCPCGCGRTLGRGKSRVVQQALDLEVVLPILRRFLECDAQLPDNLRVRGAQAVVNEFETEAACVWMVGHGEADASVVGSAADRRRLQVAANGMIYNLSRLDPAWLGHYLNTVSAEHRRQISGSITYVDRASGRL